MLFLLHHKAEGISEDFTWRHCNMVFMIVRAVERFLKKNQGWKNGFMSEFIKKTDFLKMDSD